LALLAAAVFSGCSHLPLNGPDYRDITSGAAVHLASDRHAIVYDYALVDVSAAVLDSLSRLDSESFHTTFGAPRHGPPAARIGIGDVLQVSVFESSSGGLFLPAESGPRPANFVTIPTQTVSRSGTITIPYAGSVRAAGRIVPEIERDIESKLAGRAIEPQVVVSVIEQNAAAVSVVGDTLNGANKFRLSGSGERVLDMIARAGGTKFAGYELFVALQRKNRRATVHFPKLVYDPRENIYVMPGDTIYVYREPQKFVAIGALGSVSQTSGLTGQFSFDQDRLSLNEALAKAGGLQDARANPAQVFLYRAEYRETLERIGVDLSHFAPNQRMIPTVYRTNFRDPSSFFAAQGFPMRNKDVIYAANSDAVEVIKFLGYVRTITSTVAGVSSDAALTRDVMSGRHILSE
jgi:polysaccharide export outer membrane protein